MFLRDKRFLIKTILLFGLWNFPNTLISSENNNSKEPKSHKLEKINWVKIKEDKFNNSIKWEESNEPSFFNNEEFYRVKEVTKPQFRINSLNRSLVFDNNIIGPDISWLVPPGFAWNKKYKFDSSVRGHNRRKDGESFLNWNGGDAVGQFYYQPIGREKYSIGLNMGMRSVYKGNNAIGGQTDIGEGLSAGFRFDRKLSDNSGIAFGAEQLLHFDSLTDTGRDIYITATKGWWKENIDGVFPLNIFTAGLGTGKLAEGNIKGLCSDLLGGSGTEVKYKRNLCWAPIFSVSRVHNEKLSTFFEYNSKDFLLGTSIIPYSKVPLRGTFAVILSDHVDNYKIHNFQELRWVFRLSLGF